MGSGSSSGLHHEYHSYYQPRMEDAFKKSFEKYKADVANGTVEDKTSLITKHNPFLEMKISADIDIGISSTTNSPPKKKKKKNRAVISYRTTDQDYLRQVRQLLASWGFEPWDGSQVVAAADWVSQWMEMVEDEDTILVVFLLSEQFFESTACNKEFHYVLMNKRLAEMAVPISLIEGHVLQNTTDANLRKAQFMLIDCNYVHKTPQWKHDFCQSVCNKYPSFFVDYNDEEQSEFDEAMDTIKAQIDDNEVLVGIIGSTSFYNENTCSVLDEIGRQLARLESNGGKKVVIVSGGFKGVGERLTRAFDEGRKGKVLMVLPRTDPQIESLKEVAPLTVDEEGCTVFGKWDYGRTLHVGSNRAERETFLGSVLSIIIMVEGGPGALHEAMTAAREGNIVVPLGCLGGAAKDFAQVNRCRFEDEQCKKDWDILIEAESASKPQAVATAVCNLVQYHFDIAQKDAFDPNFSAINHENSSTLRGKVWPENIREGPQRDAVVSLVDSITVVGNISGLRSFIKDNTASEKFPEGIYLALDGHGMKNQYANMDEDVDSPRYFRKVMKAKLFPLVERLNDEFGVGKWCIVYGGDPFKQNNLDVAVCVKVLAHDFNVKIIAIQCDMYADLMLQPENDELYSHMRDGAVMFYKTERILHPVKKAYSVAYGGYHPYESEKTLVGASKFFFHELLSDQFHGYIVVGGGQICKDNVDHCLFQLKNKIVYYLPSRAKFAPGHVDSSSAWYGQIHDFILLPKVFPTLLSQRGRVDVINNLLSNTNADADGQVRGEIIWELVG